MFKILAPLFAKKFGKLVWRLLLEHSGSLYVNN